MPEPIMARNDNAGQIVKFDHTQVTRVVQLTHDLGWIEWGYEEGSVEFTILQVTLHGDYRIPSDEALARIYGAVLKEIGQ